MKSFIPLILILSLISFGKSDLPVKCLPHQVEGDWRFEYTKPKAKIPFIEMNCGHEFPDNENTSADAYQKDFKTHKEFKATLSKDGCLDCSLSNDSKEQKVWTNVYNEGIDFTIGSKNIFAFYYYKKSDSGGYDSICSKTAVGWFVDDKTKEYACIRGTKLSGAKEVNSMDKKKVVVEGSIKDVPLNDNTEETKLVKNLRRKMRFKSQLASQSKLKLTSDFKDFDKYVEVLNSNPHSTWKAKNYNEYSNMTLQDLNRFVGRSRGNDLTFSYPKMKEELEKKKKKSFRFREASVKGEPNEYFSWENCLTPAKSQGGCGSCFALSSVSMMEARLRLKEKSCSSIDKEPSEDEYKKVKETKAKNKKTNMISLSHVLDCNFYNQGCEGGYPFLVGKFAHDNFYMMGEDYKKGENGDMKKKCSKLAMGQKKVKAKEYGYVGGRYTLADEEAIKEEIKKNGPVVLSYEPRSSFAFYDDGIYENIDTWATKHTSKPEWTQVDHSVLAFGYGSDAKGNKYWLLQNSWGSGFGKDGNFKMARGVDQDGIESMAEYADPYIDTN